MKKILCISCNFELEKDHIALNRKLLGRNIKKLMCLRCLAEYLDCQIDDLLTKIEEYKEQDCGLFSK